MPWSRTLTALLAVLLSTAQALAQSSSFGITPTTAGTLAVTTSSDRVQLGANGTTVVIQNTGTDDVYLAFGTSSVTATTSGHALPAGKTVTYNLPVSSYVAAIAGSSSSTIKITQGTGPTAVGGGGGTTGGLPAGAATSANQTSVIGTKAAGTAATNSLLTGAVYNSGGVTLTDGQQAATQADASGNIKVVGAGVAQGSTTSGQTGSLVLGAVTTDPPGYTTAQSSPISLTPKGALRAGNIECDSTAIYDTNTSGSTQLVALSASQTIYVCGYSIMAGGTVNVKLVYGTGTNCDTGAANMTPAWQLTAQVGLVDGSPVWRGLATAVSNALCINASAGVAVQAIVYYNKGAF